MKFTPYNNFNRDNIKELENIYNISLPEDYIDFITKYNGGNIEDGYFYVKELNQVILMSNFFGTSIKEGFADLIKINAEFNDDSIPEHTLLIGTDAGNSFILLVNDGENNGLWLYDDSNFFPQSSDDLNTYFICETFTEFMEILEITLPPKE